MLPIHQSLSKFSESFSDSKFREYIITQNRLLSTMVAKNYQVLRDLESILSQSLSSSDRHSNHPSKKLFLTEAFSPQHVYNCKLKLTEEFPVSICKSKYFKLTAQLVCGIGVEVLKEDRFSVFVNLYSYDTSPKKITHTMQGKNIFRGNIKSVLAHDIVENRHLVHFKLQIKEVSSHFTGGMFYLVLETEQELENRGVFIKPLIISNLKVRAKDC